MLTDKRSTFATAVSRPALALDGLAGLDARRLLAGTRRAGSAHAPADASLRMALARELRLGEVLADRRMVVDDLPAHIIGAVLAVNGPAREDDELETANDTGEVERLTAWDAAGTLVGLVLTSCHRLTRGGQLGCVSQLELSGQGRMLRVVAVPAQGRHHVQLAVDELHASGRRLGALDVRRLVGATIDDAVPMTGALPDEARAVWLRASTPSSGRLHALIAAPRDGEGVGATLVFERCRDEG